MENISLNIGNNSQNILPVPYPQPPIPNVESPHNYGSSPFPMPLKPSSRKDDDSQYCNFLEPSPRDQRLNVPYEGKKNCPSFKAQPYGKDSCYLMDSKAQGVVGIVCNEAGGSDNANFYRGNQFGVDHDFEFDKKMELKKQEYTVQRPVQLELAMKNPMVVYDKNTFYPEPSFPLRKNKDFLTYPLQQNYTEKGLPTYTYPYKTMNPIFEDPTQNNDVGMRESPFENFDNYVSVSNNKSQLCFLILFIFVLLIIMYI